MRKIVCLALILSVIISGFVVAQTENGGAYIKDATFTPIDTDNDGLADSLKGVFTIHSDITINNAYVFILLEDYGNNTASHTGITEFSIRAGEEKQVTVISGYVLGYLWGGGRYTDPWYFRGVYGCSCEQRQHRSTWYYLYPYHYGYDVVWFQRGMSPYTCEPRSQPPVVSADLDGDGNPDSIQLKYNIASNKYNVPYIVKLYLKDYYTNETVNYAEASGEVTAWRDCYNLSWPHSALPPHLLNVSVPSNCPRGLYKAYVELYNQYGELQQSFMTHLPSNHDWYYLFPKDYDGTLIANFIYTVYKYHTVRFEDASMGNIVSRHWDFGDGSTSTEQNPTHTYADYGIYNVTLTVTDANGNTDSITRTVNVAGIQVNFIFYRDGNVVNFIDKSKSSEPIVSWLWDFGDGTTSTEQNPTHTYASPGKYKVTLTVTDAAGRTASWWCLIDITEIGHHLTADFNYTIVGKTVVFIDLSEGNIISWHWDFGDGNTSIQQNPVHKYAKAGTYTVTLAITGPNNTRAATTKTVVITGEQGKTKDISLYAIPLTGVIAAVAISYAFTRKRW